MSHAVLRGTALATLLLSSSLVAQITPVGPFTGAVSEGFNDQNAFAQPCLEKPVFDGLGQVCGEAPDEMFIVNNATGPLSNPCNISDHTFGVGPVGRIVGNIDIDGNTDSGRITISFDVPVIRIGGWFANNDSLNSPDQGDNEVQFYDADDNLLLDSTFLMTNDCVWNWNGWEVVSGPGISRVVFRGGSSSRDITFDDFEVDFAPSFTDLGQAMTGVSGSPELSGLGVTVEGNTVRLRLTDAAPSAPAPLVLGFSTLFAPFKGGTLVPAADLVLFGATTTAAGSVVLTSTWPAGVPHGVSVYAQYWVEDATGPAGWVASNGLQITGY